MLKKISFAAFLLSFCLANASQISNGIAVVIENDFRFYVEIMI